MALYEVIGPDGITYQVEGPENAPKAEIIAAVRRQIREDKLQSYRDLELELYSKERETAEEVDLIDQVEGFGKGLIGGAVGVLESAALGVITPLPEDAEQVLRSGIQAVGDFTEDYITGADEGEEDLVSRKFGEALGSFGGILAATAVNPFLGAGVAVSAGAGEASERARAGDATAGERAGATALGAVVGASELVSPMRFLKFFREGLGDNASDAILNRLGRIAREGSFEGLQEAAAGVAQNLIEQGIYNPERGTFEGTGEAAAYGGGVGGFVQSLVELAAMRRRTRGDGDPDLLETDLPVLEEGQEQGELFPSRVASPYVDSTKVGGLNYEGAPDFAVTDLENRVVNEFLDEQEIKQYTPVAIEALAAQGVTNPTELQIADTVRDLRVADATRSAARTDTAQPELFSFEGDRTRQLEEERAQREARDREALRAVDARDEASFEQPDLFAADQESRRERGVDEFNVADQFMDTPEGEDLGQFSRTDRELKGRITPDDSAVSEVTPAPVREDVAGDINVNAVRQEIITTAEEAGIPIRNEKQLNDLVLQEINFRESELAAPREREAAAQDPKQLDIEEAIARSPVPEIRPADFQTDPEGVTTARTEVPFVPEGRERKPRRSAADSRGVVSRLTAPKPRYTPEPVPEEPAPEPTPDPVPVTKEMLDELGVLPKANLRKEILNKDLNSETVRKKLAAYSRNKVIQEKYPNVSRKITNLLEGTRDEQTDTLRGDVPQDQQRPVPARDDTGTDRTSFTPAGQPRVGSPDTARAGTPTGRGLGDTGVSPARPTGRTAGRTTPLETTSLTPLELTTPTERGLGDIGIGPDGVARAATTKPTTVAKTVTPVARPVAEAPALPPETKALLDRVAPMISPDRVTFEGRDAATEIKAKETPTEGVAKKAAPTKRAAAKKAAAKAAPKQATAKKAAPEAAPKKTRVARPKVAKETTRKIKSKVKELTNDNVLGRPTSREDTAFGGRVVYATDSDTNKIIELIEGDKPNKNSKNYGAYQYFSKHQDPSAALLHIAADLRASALPQQNMTAADADYVKKHFEGTGKIRAAQARQWVEKNLDAETNSALQEQIDFLQAEEAVLIDDVAKYGEGYASKEAETAAKKAGTFKASIDRKVAEAEAAQEKAKTTAIANNTGAGLPQPTPVKVFSKKEIEKYIAENKPEPPKGTGKKPKTARETEKQALRAGDDVVTEADTDIEAAVAAGFDIYKTKQKNRQSLELPSDAVVGLDIPVHPAVRDLVKSEDLAGALQALRITGATGRVRQLAGVLSKVVGDTKLEVRQFVVAPNGESSAGNFDPKTNTITLNAETGINAHTILHEMTHAATSQTLANKSHPMTKQLTKLFNDVKDSLDTAYGARDVDEFVAEAFGNPVFQQKLAKINIKGEPISALQRFFNTVSNVLRRGMGMQTKPVDSALNATDNLIHNMLAPAPNYRNAGALHMMSTRDGVKKLAETVGNVHKSLGPLTPESRKKFVDNSMEFFESGVAGTIKNIYLKLLGTKSLADVTLANGLGTIGTEVHVTLENQRGDIQASDAEVKKVVLKVSKWARAHPKQKAALDRIIYSEDYGATIYQVDPFDKRSVYEDKVDESGNDLAEVWDRQQKEIEKKLGGLKSEGMQAYKDMRDLYKKQYKELEAVINGEIDVALATEPNDTPERKKEKAAGRQKLKNDVFAKLFDRSTLRVYFPLMREGKYKLSYSLTDSKRDPYVMRMFDTKRERDAAAKEAEADPDIVKGSVTINDGIMTADKFKNVPSTSFVGSTLAVLQENNVSSDVQDRIMGLFIDSLPETSFARSLQKRKGTIGYLSDSVGALRVKGYDIGRQTQRLKYASKLRQLEQRIEKLEPENMPARKSVVGKIEQASIPSIRQNKDELIERTRFGREGARNKNTERYYKTANQGAFIFTIGFNVSSALVNMTQVPVFAYPYMAAEHGSVKAFQAIMFASKLAVNAGASNKNIDKFYDVSDDGKGGRAFTVKKDLNLPKEQMAQLKEAETLMRVIAGRGALGQTFIQDVLGLDEGGRAGTGSAIGRGLDAVSGASAVFFQAGEKFNRQTILMAQYNLILDKMKTATGKGYYSNTQGKFVDTAAMDKTAREELAATEAMYQTEQTNGGMVLETAPSLAQQGIGRVALMYKTYGLNMYYTMFRSAKLWLDSEKDPQIRKTAFKQLVGVHGSALLFAGVQGVPIYGMVSMIADLFFLDDEEEDFDTIVRTAIGEGWYKGPISEFSGADISDRVKLNGLVLQENRYNTDPSAEEFIGQLLGGPALSTGKRLIRGVTDLANGELQRGTESMLPPAIANMYKASPFGRYQQDDGIYTRRGDPIYDDLTGGELLSQFMGFAPTGYTFEQERNQITKGIDRAVNERRTKLLKKYYVAKRMGDYDTLYKIREDMYDFNARHYRARITPESIDRSMAQHVRTSAKMHNGITLSPLMRKDLLELRGEWQD